jgi:hypothetical protein
MRIEKAATREIFGVRVELYTVIQLYSLSLLVRLATRDHHNNRAQPSRVRLLARMRS